jgi:hypothetical protein
VVTNKETIEKIRRIIDKHYKRLTISVLGASSFTNEELRQLETLGVDINNPESFIELVYNHNFVNPALEVDKPTSVEDMRIQQNMPGVVPKGEAHDYTIESLNDKTKQLIDKLKSNVQTSIEGIIYQNNDDYKRNALQNLDRTFEADELIKESSLATVKQKLRDTAKDANRDWQRVALTEMGNAIGAASVDRIVSLNTEKDLDTVYVYRLPVNDEKTCKYCRRFYNDDDGSPKVYKLSTLLANGTNYGKKTDQWQPVTGSTHPNSRTSQVIELPPGFQVQPNGTMSYIGLDKWNDYIQNKLTS